MKVLSEQGEQEAEKQSILWASPTETENWVTEAKTEHPNRLICKRRGRHDYEEIGPIFVGITKDGLWVRRRPCHDCHGHDEPVQVERVELWEVKHYKGKIKSMTLVVAYPNYLDQSYLNTGGGRMKPRGIQSAEITILMRGESYRDTRKEVILAAAPQLPELVEEPAITSGAINVSGLGA